jgi:hypothetical protein
LLQFGPGPLADCDRKHPDARGSSCHQHGAHARAGPEVEGVAATPQAIAKLQAAINDLEKEKQETAETLLKAKQASQKIGLRKFAAQAGIDPTNLNKTIKGNRRHGRQTPVGIDEKRRFNILPT